ncbi:MAG TPA: hypothetical protein VH877_29290 [Polyangia bacterium]|nr:hypothetical protein [Polyangia bacterium]
MPLTSFLANLRVQLLAALFLVACSNPPSRPSQNQGQAPADPAPAAPRPPGSTVAPPGPTVAPTNPPAEAARPTAPSDPSAPAAPAPALPRPAAVHPVPQLPAKPRPCIDIRPVLMRCKPGERLTHEGCPEPAYMQHCVPDQS